MRNWIEDVIALGSLLSFSGAIIVVLGNLSLLTGG